MRCDRCGAPSVYHSTIIVNGVSEKTCLCRECAIKEGVFNQKTSLFDEMFTSFSDLLGFEQIENIVCPVCKTSLKDFKLTGALGCPNCYDMFRDEISKTIKKIEKGISPLPLSVLTRTPVKSPLGFLSVSTEMFFPASAMIWAKR